MKKRMEIFLEQGNISKEKWYDFLIQINWYQRPLHSWYLEIHFEKNKIRYYVETHSLLPPVLSGFPEFVFRECDLSMSEKAGYRLPTYLGVGKSSHEIFDLLSIQKKKDLYKIRIKITPFNRDHFYSSIYLFFQKKNHRYKKKLLLTTASSTLSSPSDKEQRFFYEELPKYLNIKKSIHLFSSKETNPIFKVEPFPYSSSLHYLNIENFSFYKHSLIVGSSGTGKSKFISSYIEQIQKYQGKDSEYKIMIIDPHASLEKDVGGLENTEVINFQNVEKGIDLFLNETDDFVSTTELLLSLFGIIPR